MKFCQQCGTPTSPGHAFCGSCGAPVTAETTANPAETAVPTAPYAQPVTGQTPYSTPSPYDAPTGVVATGAQQPFGVPTPGDQLGFLPPGGHPQAGPPRQPSGFTPVDLLRGNWIAAFLTAFAALFLAFGISAGLIWMGDPPDTSTKDRLILSTIATASTVSANASGSLEVEGDEVSGNAGTVPLTVALISLGVAAWLFRRMTRSYATVGHALGDAVRAGLLFALMLMVLTISLRGDENDDLFKEVWGEVDDGEAHWGATVASSFFMGFLVLTTVLVLVCVVRRDWLGPRLRRAHEVVAAPLRGVAVYLMALPVAGGIAHLCFWFTANKQSTDTDGTDANQVAAMIIGSLGNVGALFQSLGSGARVGGSWDARDWDGDRGAEWERLKYLIDESDAWGGWFAIPTLLLVLGVTAYVVLRGGRATGRPMTNLLVWAGAMFVVSPILMRLAGINGSGSGDADGRDYAAEGYAGVKPSDYFLIPLIALLVALVVGAVTGALDVKALAARMQHNPAGAAAPQPGGWPPQPPVPTNASYDGQPGWQPTWQQPSSGEAPPEPPTQWGESGTPPR